MPKKTTDGQEFSREREFKVSLENINGNIATVVDDVKSVKNRVNFMFEELGRQKEDLYLIKADLRIVKNDTGEMKITLVSHDKRLLNIENILSRHDKRISHLETACAK